MTENWKIVQNIINWEIIEGIIKKALKVRLDEKTKIAGLKMIGEKYGEELLELPPAEIEKELAQYYMKVMKGKVDANEIEQDEESEDDEDFFEELEESAQMHPELQYITQIAKMNPEFKEIIKKLRKGNQDEDDDKRNETMYI